MKIVLLTLDLHLSGCNSLKEKRQRLYGLRDRLGKRTNTAVCESGRQDSHTESEWSFVVAGSDATTVEQSLEQIEEFVENEIDARIVNSRRETL